jgi:xylan 1,4-beta-xylosidase
MYKATALALKSVDDGLLVGGPATARVEWLSELAGYCSENNLPIDFFATHAYIGDPQDKLFGDERYPLSEIIPEAMRRARQRINATAFAGRPLWLSEWNCDSPAMIAQVISGCLDTCHALSHWVLSGTYEELGVFDYWIKEGNAGFSTMIQGIAKPSLNTYKLLHALGTQRLAAQGPVLATRRADQSTAALVWNLAQVEQPGGIPDPKSIERKVEVEAKRLEIGFAGARAGQRAQVRYVDMERGSPLPAWREMGSPRYLKPEQLATLRKRADVQPHVTVKLDRRQRLSLDLPAEGVALIELI